MCQITLDLMHIKISWAYKILPQSFLGCAEVKQQFVVVYQCPTNLINRIKVNFAGCTAFAANRRPIRHARFNIPERSRNEKRVGPNWSIHKRMYLQRDQLQSHRIRHNVQSTVRLLLHVQQWIWASNAENTDWVIEGESTLSCP